MRTIKFRGWDKVGNKGWVYGDLVHAKGVSKDSDEDLYDRVMIGGYEVVPDSVGQLTGMVDCIGNKIYEGDCLRIHFGSNSTEGVVKYDAFSGGYAFENEHNYFSFICITPANIEIIGNIYEQNKK